MDTIITPDGKGIVIQSFVPRRWAQMYAEIYMTKGREAAGEWVWKNIEKEKRPLMRPYLKQAFRKYGVDFILDKDTSL